MATTTLDTALLARLRAQGIGLGDEVVVPAYGDSEVAVAVRDAGARPVFADIDPGSLCLDPASVAEVAGERTVAVVPVHAFGRPADMTGLREVAQHRNLRIVEGGEPPSTASVDAIRRRQHADFLNARLTGVIVPSVPAEVQHAYEQYVVRVPGNGRPDRDAFKQALRARGVACHVPVRIPVHWLPEFRTGARLPEAERAADECLALPLEASMSRRDLQRVVSACNALGGLLMEPAC